MKYFEMQSNYSNLMKFSLAVTLPSPIYFFVPVRRFASGRLQNACSRTVARSNSLCLPVWERNRSSQVGAANGRRAQVKRSGQDLPA
jgi:hypothetical protein